MEVTETKNEGLKHAYAVKLDAASINEQIESQLQSMAGRVKIPGFRPGHIPMSVLKQRFGKNVMGEVLERAVNQASQRVMKDKNVRPALNPKVEITSYEEGGDLNFTMDVETMPEIGEIDYSAISLEKLTADIEETEVEEAVTRLGDRNKSFSRAAEGSKAEKGSQLLMDFVGRIDGTEFEGGAAKQFQLELGSGQFIEGFEDQLTGVAEGEKRTVNVRFPSNYHKEDLAGKPAEFDVTVHEIRDAEAPAIDDDFAKKLGFDNLEAVKKAVRDQFAGDYESASRAKTKKQLFDKLEMQCEFPIPEGMREVEFKNIWEKLQQAKKEGDEGLQGKSDDELRAEYGKIADRRVKLGILLSEIAQKNKIQITQDELSRAVMQQASQFPGQERRIFEFYQKNPQHVEELRGPILEEKAVDYILGLAQVTERKVSRSELMQEEGENSPTDGVEDNGRKPRKKAANE